VLSIRSLLRLHLGPLELTLLAGKLVALSGSSGAGKIVFLRAIADLEPNDGSVELDGVKRSSIPAPQWRRKVSNLTTDSGWWATHVGTHFSDLDQAPPLLKKFRLPDDILTWPIPRL
jgi:phosphate-transporting ATPase